MVIIVQTLSEQVYNLIRDRIISGELSSETAIRQDALAKELGVSKIPLREAFARLERDGLLHSIPNRGYFVRQLSTAEAEEVYALRLKIEPDAAATASQMATDADRQAARAALRAFAEVEPSDQAAHGRLNRAFHMALVNPLGQRTTTEFVERLNIIAERYASKHLEPEGRYNRAEAEHGALLKAWEKRDSDLVNKRMRAHIVSTLEDLRKQF